MSNVCVYCDSAKNVKVWDKTNEYVCLSCRMSFLADEFEETASKEDCDQVKYYGELMGIEITKFDRKGGEDE